MQLGSKFSRSCITSFSVMEEVNSSISFKSIIGKKSEKNVITLFETWRKENELYERYLNKVDGTRTGLWALKCDRNENIKYIISGCTIMERFQISGYDQKMYGNHSLNSFRVLFKMIYCIFSCGLLFTSGYYYFNCSGDFKTSDCIIFE